MDIIMDTTTIALDDWITRLQKIRGLLDNPENGDVQVLLSQLAEQAVIGNIFRLQLEGGSAIRVTCEMCLVVPVIEAIVRSEG